MANNFRIAGTRYVSKGGHDSNDGLTPDTPKKSISDGSQAGIDYVVGSGIYNVNTTNYLVRSCTGDGKVIIDFGNGSGQKFSHIDTTGFFENLHFRNSSGVNICPNSGVQRNCIYQNMIMTGGGVFMSSCILINSDTTAFNNAKLRTGGSSAQKGSIFISGSHALRIMKDSYSDFSSTILYDSGPTGFSHNNIQGVIVLGGVKYAIKDQFTGTPQDNGYGADVYWLNEANLTANGYTGTIAGWDAAVATCINRDPKFNNASKLDFTLQADSPHIGRASDGFSNIGGTEYALSFYAGISNPNILLFETSEAIDTTTNNNDWRLKPGYSEGWIRAIIKVSNNDVQISSIPYIGNYSFDSDQAGGNSTNMNVPDSKPITNEYPNYLTVTTQAANDTTLIIAGHGAVVGDWLWVDGQYREITGVPDADTVTFATSLRAIVVVGTVVKIGTFESLASLNPNRLNMKMRSSKLADVNASNWDNPLTWDNDGLAPAGQYMAQEWNNAPMIDSLNEVGFGDDSYDANYGNPINLKVVDIMIYLRNNYRS